MKHSFITVEGVIGVGKTSLSRILAEKLGWRLCLEEVDENPFLERFYRDRQRYALQTQLFFLLSRFKQHEGLTQGDLFSPEGIISDYLLLKDRLFAQLNLADDEMALYEKIWTSLYAQVAKPDLVVLLTADVDVLMARIEHRGRSYERGMDRQYIKELNDMYRSYFYDYTDSSLLIVDTTNIDFVNNEKDQEELLRVVTSHRGGSYAWKGETAETLLS